MHLPFYDLSHSEVEVSSDAAAAIKQQSDGQKQTFISSQSKAKTGKDSSFDKLPEQEAGQRSSQTLPMEDSKRRINFNKKEHTSEFIWGYSDTPRTFGPNNWSKYYPICNGSNQSPIPLQAEQNKASTKFLKIIKLDTSQSNGLLYGSLVNDGHSFGMLIDENRSDIKITGGPLDDQTYALSLFNIHFSCDNKETASEHSMDGLKYSAELHFVFYNKKYENFQSSIDKSDGLTVLAFFIKVAFEKPYSGNDINHGIFFINRYLIDISSPGTSISVAFGLSMFDLVKKLRDGADNLSYAYYQGSLTTPPCYESVIWIVFQDPIKVPLRDMESWRKLNGGRGLPICNNYRPLQSINGRQMFFVSPTKAP
ncbi:LOW QUALITY PROTEIN: hypothetical protein MXB_1862 [Myxobolus squamalis]|nr:LOW QUALITY PROTEIN: hypothetical protein MXB_1862 [Myxobolus squamalis]